MQIHEGPECGMHTARQVVLTRGAAQRVIPDPSVFESFRAAAPETEDDGEVLAIDPSVFIDVRLRVVGRITAPEGEHPRQILSVDRSFESRLQTQIHELSIAMLRSILGALILSFSLKTITQTALYPIFLAYLYDGLHM